jgi:acyl-CoA synthetase (AMP-forming)/AMP-acid ligase II
MGSDKRIQAGLMYRWAPRNFPDKVAAICGPRRVTHRELDEAANRLANALRGLGLVTGDRVAVLLHNSIETLIVSLAIERAGLAFVRLSPQESPELWNYVLEHSEARAMLIDARFVEQWKQADFGQRASRLEIAIPASSVSGVLCFDQLLAAASPAEPNIMAGYDDLRAISYTSGTTGKPKGIAYTVGAWLARLRNDLLNQDRIIDHTDVLLSVAPLTHAAGVISQVYTIRGATHVILDKFDAQAVCETIQRERVTSVFLVPTMLARLINDPHIRAYDFSSLRRIYYAAAPISVETLKQAIGIFGHRVFRQHYGLSEHPQPITLLHPADHDAGDDPKKIKRLGSVGWLAIGAELKIVDEDGAEAGAGQAGEILIRGDAGMREYWKDPEATARAFVDGWIRTGDIGQMDEDGYLYLVDRKQEMIISGGFNIYPREIEQVIENHPAVLEVCVIGVPDDEWGEAVKALVVLQAGAKATEEEIIELCRRQLGRYKKPRSVEFVAELPKNAAGKLLRRVARERYWEGRQRKI